MNKSLVALFAALVAVATMFASTAEAGLKIKLGFGGPLPHFHAHGNGSHSKRLYYRKRYVARRAAKQTVVAKKSKPSVTKVAKVSKPKVVAAAPVETVEEPEVIAENENSSIASAVATALDKAASADEAQPVEVKADAADTAAAELKRTSKLDCKKFFPSVGMTLTVPCE